MRWLIDEMLPDAIAQALNDRGHDAVSVTSLAMQGAQDSDVLQTAITEHRILVTENFADFASLIESRQRDNEPCTPVVFLRESAFPSGGALASHIAEHLDAWAAGNPDPYEGLHWP